MTMMKVWQAVCCLVVCSVLVAAQFDPMIPLQSIGNLVCQNQAGSTLEYWGTGSEYNDQTGFQGCSCNQAPNGTWMWCPYWALPCVGYSATTSPPSYFNIQQTPAPPFVFTSYFNNNSTETDQIQFSRSETTSNSYSWSITESVTVGVTISVEAGIPGICEANDQFSMSLDMSSTQTQTGTDTKSWSVEETINVPPHSTIRVDILVGAGQFSADFTTAINFIPNSAGMFSCQGSDRIFYVVFPSDFLSYGSGPGVSCGYTSCNTTGSFSGLQGINVQVNVTQCQLGIEC